MGQRQVKLSEAGPVMSEIIAEEHGLHPLTAEDRESIDAVTELRETIDKILRKP